MPVFLLSEEVVFPPVQFATPEGLLAVGGDLSLERLLLAYHQGIFPWYQDEEPILWWSPDPRLVLYPSEIRLSRSLKKTIRKGRFRITADQAFGKVIAECARIRTESGQGTWIGRDMMAAYRRLHAAGYAHSVEAWGEDGLAGGLYGVSLGGSFFGESMFARVKDASKVAFARLTEFLAGQSFDMIDCQVTTAHLMRFGARDIPRKAYLRQLEKSLRKPTLRGKWELIG